MKYYIHHVPGRMRIESPMFHENSTKASEFEDFIKGINGISSVECHTLTGSATIHYDGKKINCEQIIGILEKHDYFHLICAETCDERVEMAAEKTLEVAEKVIESEL